MKILQKFLIIFILSSIFIFISLSIDYYRAFLAFSVLIASAAFLFQKKEILTTIFLFFIFQRGSLEDQSVLFDPAMVSAILLIVLLISSNLRKTHKSLSKTSRNAIFLYITYILINLVLFIKGLFLEDYMMTIQYIGKVIIIGIASSLIIKNLDTEKAHNNLHFSITITIIFLSIQAIFYQLFISSGYLVTVRDSRATGFINMDENIYSRLIVVSSIYLFSILGKKFDLLCLLAVILGFIAILVAGSRTGITLFLLFIVICTTYSNFFSISKIYIFLPAIVFLLLINSDFGGNVRGRFSNTVLADEGRFLYLPIYINEMTKNPDILIFGSDTKIEYYTKYKMQIKDQQAHNVYIQITFYLGLFFLIAFLYPFFKLIKNYNKNTIFDYRYPLYAYLAFSLTISDFNLGFLPLIIALSVKDFKYNTPKI